MEPEKAPGLDGLSGGFYQQHWETFGTEVCTAVLFFLNSAIMDGGMHCTIIFPKFSNYGCWC
jgi:hypothetical protein